jgi:hypothetical protein
MVVTIAAALFLSGCGNDSKEQERLRKEAEDIVNEAENRQQEQYGDDRIVELLTSLSASSCRDMVEALKTDTDRFRDGAEPNDDLTMLAVHVSKS